MRTTLELTDRNEFTFSEKDSCPYSDAKTFYLKYNSNKPEESKNSKKRGQCL